MNVTFTTKQTKAIHVLISQLHIDNKVTKHFQRRYIDDNMMNPEEAQKIYDRMPHYKKETVNSLLSGFVNMITPYYNEIEVNTSPIITALKILAIVTLIIFGIGLLCGLGINISCGIAMVLIFPISIIGGILWLNT